MTDRAVHTSSETVKLTFRWNVLEALLPKLLNAPLEIREAFLSGLEAGTEFFRIEGDVLTASGTPEVVVRLEPTDRLVSLLAATGAGH